MIKKLALALAILLSQFTTEAQTVNLKEVGKIENGNLILTVDANTICNSLSKNLARVSTVNEQFTKVDLVKIDSSYFIVFQGSKWTTTFAVVANDGKLMANVGVSCSTSDASCSNSPDCAPSSNVGECVCTRCSNAATCTKTCTMKCKTIKQFQRLFAYFLIGWDWMSHLDLWMNLIQDEPHSG